jgi:hypothetical protein
MLHLAGLYDSIPGNNLRSLETLKSISADLFHHTNQDINLTKTSENMTTEEKPRIYNAIITQIHKSSSSDSSPKSDTDFVEKESLTTFVKQLREDIALIRRIGRVPESEGVNVKKFLSSGKLIGVETIARNPPLHVHSTLSSTSNFTLTP